MAKREYERRCVDRRPGCLYLPYFTEAVLPLWVKVDYSNGAPQCWLSHESSDGPCGRPGNLALACSRLPRVCGVKVPRKAPART